MLSDEEKREMLEDARSENRRKDFMAAKRFQQKDRESFEDYIIFLDSIQKFYPLSHRPIKTITKFYKL